MQRRKGESGTKRREDRKGRVLAGSKHLQRPTRCVQVRADPQASVGAKRMAVDVTKTGAREGGV